MTKIQLIKIYLVEDFLLIQKVLLLLLTFTEDLNLRQETLVVKFKFIKKQYFIDLLLTFRIQKTINHLKKCFKNNHYVLLVKK